VPNGELTPLLHRLNPGDPLSVRRAPKGRMTLDVSSGRHQHLLLCTVTGIAPFVSYARTLLEDWKAGRFKGEHQLYLIQGASHSREFGYREEMEHLFALLCEGGAQLQHTVSLRMLSQHRISQWN